MSSPHPGTTPEAEKASSEKALLARVTALRAEGQALAQALQAYKANHLGKRDDLSYNYIPMAKVHTCVTVLEQVDLSLFGIEDQLKDIFRTTK